MTRRIMLMGAPEAKNLDWSPENLLTGFTEPFVRFANLQGSYGKAELPESSALANHAAWRSLPLERQHLTTGFSQDHGWQSEFQGNADFFVPGEVSFLSTGRSSGDRQSEETTEDVLSQFYEESFAIHEDVPSSSLAGSFSQQNETANKDDSIVTDEERSFMTNSSAPVAAPPRKPVPTGVGHLSDLEDIPSANYLTKIQPHTMTVNLIVGIISVSPVRTISTKRGQDVELIEVTVGDETKTGFTVNFWLSPGQSKDAFGRVLAENMKSAVENLRVQDVVLLRNVALGSFRGMVNGQSLRNERTKVHLLYRNKVDRKDVGGCYTAIDLAAGTERQHPQIEKIRRVREWILRFVGGGAKRTKDGTVKRVIGAMPPLDSP